MIFGKVISAHEIGKAINIAKISGFLKIPSKIFLMPFSLCKERLSVITERIFSRIVIKPKYKEAAANTLVP